jgi:hypothetical protein
MGTGSSANNLWPEHARKFFTTTVGFRTSLTFPNQVTVADPHDMGMGRCKKNLLPKSKHTKNYGKSPFYSWVNQLFLWSFSIAMFLMTLSGRWCNNHLEKCEFVNEKDYPIYYGK